MEKAKCVCECMCVCVCCFELEEGFFFSLAFEELGRERKVILRVLDLYLGKFGERERERQTDRQIADSRQTE